MSTDGIELPQGYVERPFDYSGDLYIEGQLRPIIEANRALVSERDALLGALRQIAEWPDGGSRYGQEKIKRFAQAVIDAALAAQQPAAPSEDVNVAGMPEFDGLLDHIYEYGTASEGVIEKANAFARAVIARFAPQQPAAVDEAIDKARFEKAPCYLCGYNGPGYYQPDTHPCAAKYHAALQRTSGGDHD